MSENNSKDIGSVITETLLNNEDSQKNAADNLKQRIKHFFVHLRRNFALNCENSFLAHLLEYIYIKILVCKVRLVAVFLLSFSIVSLLFGYAVNFTLSDFVADSDTLTSIFVMIISLVLFTTNKTVHDLILSSKLLSHLSIGYAEQSIIFQNSNAGKTATGTSTAFFLGIICGIFSVIYPVSTICMFIFSAIYVVLIFNRPECGMLLMIALLPLLSKSVVFVSIIITFVALLYRYMLGKRHIRLGAAKILMLISVFYLIVRCLAEGTSFFNTRFLLYVCFYLSSITAMSLIRSTAMFRRVFNVLINMTRVFAVIFAFYYLGNIIFGKTVVAEFIAFMEIDSLANSLTSPHFIVPFLCMAIPMNFAYLVGDNKGSHAVKNTICLLMLIASLIYISTFSVILICILSCVAVLFFFKKRYCLLVIPAPLLAFGLEKLFSLVPNEYRLSLNSKFSTDFDRLLDVFKNNIAFGAGHEVNGFSGNMTINILVSFGIVGFVLLSAILMFMTAKTVKSVSAKTMSSNKARFLTIGLLCSQLSFMALCLFTDIYCDLNTIFMFSAVLSSSFVSGPCYEADFVDATTVREYFN